MAAETGRGADRTVGVLAGRAACPAGAPFLPKKWGKEGQGGGVSSPLEPPSPVWGDCWGYSSNKFTGLRPIPSRPYGPAHRLGRAGVGVWGPSGGGGCVYYLRRGTLDARPHPTRLRRPTFPPRGRLWQNQNDILPFHGRLPLGGKLTDEAAMRNTVGQKNTVFDEAYHLSFSPQLFVGA